MELVVARVAVHHELGLAQVLHLLEPGPDLLEDLLAEHPLGCLPQLPLLGERPTDLQLLKGKAQVRGLHGETILLRLQRLALVLLQSLRLRQVLLSPLEPLVL